MLQWLQRIAVDIAAADDAGFFFFLLGAVVMLSTKALPVFTVPEQLCVAAVWNNVVDVIRWPYLANLFAVHAQGAPGQVVKSGGAPAPSVKFAKAAPANLSRHQPPTA